MSKEKKSLMKVLRPILIGVVGLVALVFIVGMLLPRHVHVERSLTMNVASDVAFEQVNNLKNWDNWSPWAKIDPNTKWVYSDNPSGKDAWYSWKSNHKNVGNGKLAIVESVANQSIATKIDFEGQGTGKGNWTFEKTDGGTKVTWGMESDMTNNPIGKIMGLFMDGMLGPDFEKGLASMKAKVEG